MPEPRKDAISRADIDKELAIVAEAGHGYVLINIADHVIVNVKHEATRSIFRNEKEKQPHR